jgi:hypothetical protein
LDGELKGGGKEVKVERTEIVEKKEKMKEDGRS